MAEAWEVVLIKQEWRRKAALLEGRARPAAAPGGQEVEFSLTFYPDQVSLNVPAVTEGRQLIARLTELLGEPCREPTIKCSCDWGHGVMGAMVVVLWDLAPARLADFWAFLGASPPPGSLTPAGRR